MLVQFGQRAQPTGVVDLLVECHGRIRRFLALGRTLSSSNGENERDVRSAAEQIVRYFTVAFPLHVADENDSVFPRLAGRSDGLDTALARLRDDHADGAALDHLVALCQAIVREPRQLAAVAHTLAETVDQLTLELEGHLSLEELLVFPALRQLATAELQAVHAEMRLRRDVAMGVGETAQGIRAS